MIRKYSVLFVVVAFCVSLVSVNAVAEEAFPPGKRYMTNYGYWTSTTKLSDNVWSQVNSAIEGSELTKEQRAKIRANLMDLKIARIQSGLALGKVASKYYAATRGKDVYNLHLKYGSSIQAQDVGNMQALLNLYHDIGEKLHSEDLSDIEDMMLMRGLVLSSSLRITSKIPEEISSRYVELAAAVVGAMYKIIKVGPDLAEARIAYQKTSTHMINYVKEFYYPSSSSCDLLIYKDDKARQWIQFERALESPYGKIEDEKTVTEITFPINAEVVKKHLEEVNLADKNYKQATIDCIKAIIPQLDAKTREKVMEIAKKIGM